MGRTEERKWSRNQNEGQVREREREKFEEALLLQPKRSQVIPFVGKKEAKRRRDVVRDRTEEKMKVALKGGHKRAAVRGPGHEATT